MTDDERKERNRQRAKAWREANPEKARAQNERQKARREADPAYAERLRKHTAAAMHERRKSDPDFVERDRERVRAYLKRKRQDAEYRRTERKRLREYRRDRIRRDPVYKEQEYIRARARRFGLSVAVLQKMLADADGKCTLCRKEAKVLCIDHNHATGRVRGVICKHCNRCLSLFDLALQDADVYSRLIRHLTNGED